jgi:hypothetical protein
LYAAGQVKEFQKAIDNNKELEDTINKMRILSREFLNISTIGVFKRK